MSISPEVNLFASRPSMLSTGWTGRTSTPSAFQSSQGPSSAFKPISRSTNFFAQSMVNTRFVPHDPSTSTSRNERMGPDSFLTDKQRQDKQRQRRLEENYKTVMCEFQRLHNFCMFDKDCRYAHSEEELRPKMPAPNHKTILCRNFTARGACPYGRKCRYIHRSPDDKNKPTEHLDDIINVTLSQLDL